MENGNKLCDVISMEITRVGDPPKEAKPVERGPGFSIPLKWPYGDDFPFHSPIDLPPPEQLSRIEVSKDGKPYPDARVQPGGYRTTPES